MEQGAGAVKLADAIVGGVIGPLHAPEAAPLLLSRVDEQGRLRSRAAPAPLSFARARKSGRCPKPHSVFAWPERCRQGCSLTCPVVIAR